MNNDDWIETSERLPEKSEINWFDSHVKCVVTYKGETKILMWNCEHTCWDDAEGDDFFCTPLEVTAWQVFPTPYIEPKKVYVVVKINVKAIDIVHNYSEEDIVAIFVNKEDTIKFIEEVKPPQIVKAITHSGDLINVIKTLLKLE